jgi:hypothetical protein
MPNMLGFLALAPKQNLANIFEDLSQLQCDWLMEISSNMIG